MTTVADVADWMERFAPARLAEDWDNVGLLWGDPQSTIERIMTCLTITPASAAEAVERGAGLIVSHHPIWFKPVQSLRADGPDGFLWPLAKAGVAIHSPHTAFDNTDGGINDYLCELMELIEIEPLKPPGSFQGHKVVLFAPESDREAVLSAVFAAGAGRIGDYSECSYTLEGFGTFFGGEGTNPTIGEAGRRELAAEQRIEFVCPSDRLPEVVRAIRAAHSYEEPAFDIYPTEQPGEGPGVGRVGRLAHPTTLGELVAKAAERLNASALQFVGDPDRTVERLAVACGGADLYVTDAAKAGADAFLTGEARFHRALEAEQRGLGLLVAGHYATERPAVEMLARRLASEFPQLEIWPSQAEADPLRTAPR